MGTTRRKFSTDFKKKVILESLKDSSTIEVLSKKYELHPTQISSWKAEAIANFEQVFKAEKSHKTAPEIDVEKLYARIGQLNMEVDFLKKRV
jgi:transposase